MECGWEKAEKNKMTTAQEWSFVWTRDPSTHSEKNV